MTDPFRNVVPVTGHRTFVDELVWPPYSEDVGVEMMSKPALIDAEKVMTLTTESTVIMSN